MEETSDNMDNTCILASIIIPVYNTAPYIEECLDSIFVCQKTNHMIEVIVVNDASTDGSLDILNEYRKRHDFILITQESSGAGGARNTGINAAHGKYLLFMDSDDYLVPYSLDALLAYLAVSEDDVVQYDYKVYNEAKRGFSTNKRPPIVEYGTGQDVFAVWEENGFYRPMVWITAVSREMVISNKLYFYPEIFHQDEEWSPKIYAYANSVRYLPLVIYVYRIREGSSIANKTLKHYMDLLKCVDSLNEFSTSQNFSTGYIKALRRNFAFLYFSMIKSIKFDGDYNQYLISELEKRRGMIRFSKDFHRRTFCKYIIDTLGIKNFYILKYGYKDFL
jgi:glycosyltransferase involved in cell wall biosynthesis